MIYNSLIHSYLNGGILLWGFDPGRLTALQKKAIRAVSFLRYNAHTTNTFRQLKILKVSDIFEFRALKFYHNLINNKVPAYFVSNFTEIMQNVNLPTTRTKRSRKCLKYKIAELKQSFDRLVTDKVHTHSLEGFASYTKNHILSKYIENCNVPNCFSCGQMSH